MRSLILATALFAVPTFANAGPFGIDFLEFDIQELGCIEKKPNSYECQVPRPSVNFDLFVAKLAPDGTLCKFTAYGPIFVTDVQGVEARAKVDALVKASTDYYGQGSKEDLLDEGSSLKEPDQWTEALTEGDRYYGYWFTPSDEVEGIMHHRLWVAGRTARHAFLVADFYAQAPTICDVKASEGF